MFKLIEQERTAGLWETDNCIHSGKMAMKRNLAEMIWWWQWWRQKE